MTTRRWTFRGERELHVVELVHGWLTGKRKLTVNGRVLVDAAMVVLDGGSHHAFELDGRACTVDITCPAGIMYRYALIVDGVEIPSDDGRATLILPSVASGTVPVSASPPRAEPRDVPVTNRFIDFTRWFKGER